MNFQPCRELLLALGLLVVSSLLFHSTGLAEESRKQEYREYLEKRRQFEQERQRKFADYLEDRWQKMKEFQNSSVYSAPKFKSPPVSETSPPEASRELKQFQRVEPDSEPVYESDARATGEAAEPQSPTAVDFEDTWFTYDWYEVPVEVPDLRPLPAVESGDDLKSVAASYSRVYGEHERSELLSFLKNYRDKLNLRGWHELFFVYSAVERILEEQKDSPSRLDLVLATWAVGRDLNYDLRLGLGGRRLYLLYRPAMELPGTRYYTIDGRDYYLFLPDELGSPSVSLRTYGEVQDGPRKPARPDPTRLPELPWQPAQRRLEFKYEGTEERFELEFNRNLSRYYTEVPQVKPAHYFKSIAPAGIKKDFLAAVRRRISGLDTGGALDFLLRLTQRGFDYKTDDDHLGRQWYMIPPEASERPFTDCDDRSIFFAWLVRNLLDLEVVGVKWPGHLSTAVEFPEPEEIRGRYVRLKGRTYVLADPTYIGAGPGQVMEQLKDESPDFLFPAVE